MVTYPDCDPRHYDRRLFKGGDGGAEQARQDEERRQAKIQAGVDAINSKFNDPARAKSYDALAGTVRDLNMLDVDQQMGEASRQNMFGLARAGLTGGSVDAESGAELARRYNEGRIKSVQAGQQAAAGLKTTDEGARQNLISLAQTGMDTGAAATMSANQMAAAAESANANSNTHTVADLFRGLNQAYMQQQYLNARPAANPAPNTGFFGGSAFGRGYSGTVRN
jgi:hypothetical protein